MKLASGFWRMALGACVLLQAASARADEPKKRRLPDYDGRGGTPQTPAQKALWVPRVILFPAYVVSEYLVRRPLAAGVSYAEKHQWPAAVSDFLGLNVVTPYGATPFFLVDFGFEPSAGVYAYWDDVGFKGHSLRLRGSTWGPKWLSTTLKERFQFGENFEIFLKGKLTKRPDLAFYGIGPDTPHSALTRYSHKTAYAHFQTRLTFGGRSALETIAGYRGASFGHTDYDSGNRGRPDYQASLDEAIATGELPEPAGFRDGYQAPFAGVRVLVDSRGKSNAKNGVRLDVSAEESADLANRPSSGWLRYSGTVGGFVDLMQGGRFLIVSFSASFVDPLGDRPVPFTQLVPLGGGGTMPGLRAGRLYDRSSAVADLRYTWPIWMSLRGSLQVGVGNVFGAHWDGLRVGKSRLSTALGLETNGSGDDIFQALVGFGTETFDSGARLESIRFAVGVREGF